MYFKSLENQDDPESNLVFKIALIQTIISNLYNTLHSTAFNFHPTFSQTNMYMKHI